MAITASYGPARSGRIQAAAYVASFMLVLMLVAQLYGYEGFSLALSVVLHTNDFRAHQSLAAVIVVAELMALPYLLRMYMSKLMRVVSASSAMLIAAFWLLNALTNAHAQNSAVFSDTIAMPGGLLAALWNLVLTVCVVAVLAADSRFRNVSP